MAKGGIDSRRDALARDVLMMMLRHQSDETFTPESGTAYCAAAFSFADAFLRESAAGVPEPAQPKSPEPEQLVLIEDAAPETAAARTKRLNAEVAVIWKAWPRKENRQKGCRAIFKVLDGGYPFDDLLRRVKLYATDRPTSRTHPDFAFTPHPSTWFNQRRFEDEQFDEGHAEPTNRYDVRTEDEVGG